MAEMIPEYAVCASKTANTLHQNLSRMLGSGYRVVQYLNAEFDGSLFWIQKTHQSLFVYVSNSNTSNITIDKNQPSKLVSALSKNSEIRKLLKLQHTLLPKTLYSHKARLTPFLLFFPECEDSKIKLGIKSHGFQLAGKESLEPAKLLSLLRLHMGIAASPFMVNYLRRVFNPELILAQNHASQTSILDENQELALKSEMTLPVNTRRSDNFNLRVLNGVAGSGKTQILIHRARLLRTLYPRQKILILCHNQALKQSIESQYQQLNPGDRNIKITHFLDWCRPRLDITQKIVVEDEVTDLINNVFKRQLSKTIISKNLFLREINFIKGRPIFSEMDYLKSNRSGQSSPLDEDQRRVIWRALLTLNNELAANNMVLWNDIPRLLLQSTQEGKLLDRYDHIMVDEAQYFAPLYFSLIKKSLKQHSGQLYITYDENQGFLNNRIHWKESGLDLRGHSTKLLKSYRINPLIMRAAHAFHLNRLPEESDDIIANCAARNDNKQTKVKTPRLLHFPSVQGQQTRLLKEIHELLDLGTRANDILIITQNQTDAHTLASCIRKDLKLAVDLPTLSNNNPAALRLCPLDAATGLESPVVFIIDIQHHFESEKSETLSDREHHTLVIENTRKFYMGMTRASEQLTLLLSTDNIPEALLTPHIEIPTLPIENKPPQRAEVHYLHA